MRKLLLMVAAICAMTAFFACTDENIGNSITDTASAIIKDSSFTMTGSSVLNNKVLSRIGIFLRSCWLFVFFLFLRKLQ